MLFVPDRGHDQIREISLTYRSNGSQALRLELNDGVLFDGTVEAESPSTLTVRVPDRTLARGVNRLRFIVPDARRMRRGDPKLYGIAVKSVSFR